MKCLSTFPMLVILVVFVLSVSCGHYEQRYDGDEISDDDDDDLGPGPDDDNGGDDDSQIDDDDGPDIDNYSWVNDKGDTVELYDHLGDVVMLNVGAGWCKPCREDAPKIEDQIYQPYKDQGFTLIELIVEDDLYQIPSAEFLQSWRDQYELNYIICADPDWTLLSYFDTISLPFALILDRELKPVFQSHGYDEAIFTDMIKELL